MRAGCVTLGVWLFAASVRADVASLPCTVSDVLGEAAALLLLDGGEPTAKSLQRAGREAGFDGVSLHASTLRDDGALSGWLNGLVHRHHVPMACGEAVSADRRVVVAAPRTGQLAFRDGLVIGALAPGFSRPELMWLGADGVPVRAPVTVEALHEGVAPPEALRRPAVVQLVAEGPSGPRPVAQISLGAIAHAVSFASAPRVPEPPRARRSGLTSGARASEGLNARLDAFRASLGAPSLRENALLQHSAQRHATRVCERGQVAHRLSDGEDPVARLRRERVEARAVGEAIGRSEDAAAALEAIFASPSHRFAVAERRFTDVGIGHARDPRGRSCVVVLLAAWPRRIP